MGPSVHSEYTNTCTRPWRGVRPPDGFRVGGERESCKSAGPSASQVARRAAASAREEAVVEALEGDAIPTGGVAADVERHVLADNGVDVGRHRDLRGRKSDEGPPLEHAERLPGPQHHSPQRPRSGPQSEGLPEPEEAEAW